MPRRDFRGSTVFWIALARDPGWLQAEQRRRQSIGLPARGRIETLSDCGAAIAALVLAGGNGLPANAALRYVRVVARGIGAVIPGLGI
jgi:hypothetical protein